jgi:hypothetical protein
MPYDFQNIFCDNITAEYFEDVGLNLYKIKSLNIINNNDNNIKKYNKVYLFPADVPYGHALIDCYSQFLILKEKIPDIEIIFYELKKNKMFLQGAATEKVIKDLMFINKKNKIVDLTYLNFYFDEVFLFFDFANLFSKNFYEKYNKPEFEYYPKFCNCNIGNLPCGEDKSFKYNFKALNFIKTYFNEYKEKKENKKIYISRKYINEPYSQTKNLLLKKTNLSNEEKETLRICSMRSYDYEKEIEDYFVSIGYEIIYAENMSLFEQIKLFSKASHIAALCSTGLMNCFWADSPIVYEINVNSKYFYHFDMYGEYMGAKYFTINAQDDIIDNVLIKIKQIVERSNNV